MLDRAVADRLPGEGPVATTLSGGLDSTAVTALAARRLAGEGRTVSGFTLGPPASGVAARAGAFVDEVPRAAVLAGLHPNLTHVAVPADPAADYFATLARRNPHGDMPVMPSYFTTQFDRMLEMVRARGCTRLLTGGQGNLTISWHGYGALAAGHAGWRELAGAWRSGAGGYRFLARASLAALLPALARRPFARFDARLRDAELLQLPLHPARIAALAGSGDRLAGSLWHRDSRQVRRRGLQRHDRGPTLAAIAAGLGVELVDPTADVRVVEYCLSVPERHFIHKGRPRALIRTAMAGLVPQSILGNTWSGAQDGGWELMLDHARPRIAAEWARIEASALAREWLDMARLRRLIDHWPGRWRGAADRAAYGVYLLRGLALGSFLRGLEG